MITSPTAKAGDKRDTGLSLGGKDPLKKGVAAHSSILAWRIPWTEETGGLQCLKVLDVIKVT